MAMKTKKHTLVHKIYFERDSFATILEQNCTEYKDHLSRGSARLWLITRVKVMQSIKNWVFCLWYSCCVQFLAS